MKPSLLFLLLLVFTAPIPAQGDPDNPLHVLLIGDSNGAFDYGWANQLAAMRPADRFVNTCRSGNTIGFYNNGRQDLNTLQMIDSYIGRGLEEMGIIDRVVIMLGTNDCKAVFADSTRQVAKNMDRLIRIIQKDPRLKTNPPVICLVSPPPIGADSLMEEKYWGGSERVTRLVPELARVARKRKCVFVPTWHQLKEDWTALSPDGIHMIPEAQLVVADEIGLAMDRTSSR
ncbi:MAG: SGNH/GDSL hydrolase family protein [Bacteroidota bacterium]